jgi:protocatechuate 3,4-dioxygenase beta subunit
MRFLALLCFIVFTPFHSVGQPSPQTPATAQKQNATVAGTVVRLDNGEPLKKAKVHLQSRVRDDYEEFILTDEQGRFSFENVPPGPYDFEVFRNGFVHAEYGEKKPGAPGAILSLEPGQSMTDVVFKLARTASISGHVFDEDGEPVAKAEVIAYRASSHPGKEQRENYDSIVTNDLGEFRIYDLAPGRYFVAVNYRSQEHVQYQRRADAAEERYNPGYLPTYYPNTTDSRKAQAISVGPGVEIRSIDFLLRPTHLATVSGKVINATGANSVRWASVSLIPNGTGLANAAQNLQTNFDLKNGTFSIREVPPGYYNLVASWSEGAERTLRTSQRALEVGTSDMDDVAITLSRGVDISGRITWDGPSPKNTANLFVRLHPLGDGPFVAPGEEVKPDGTFYFRDLSDATYTPTVLVPGSEENFYVKAVRYGSAPANDKSFTVQGASDASLELIMSSHPAKVTGVVRTGDSQPAVGMKVVLIPDEAHRELKLRYMAATTDQNGRFSISGITPGDYKVFSWDSVDESDEQFGEDWFDPEWLKPYEPKGESVHLEEGDQKFVNLKLIETTSDAAASN